MFKKFNPAHILMNIASHGFEFVIHIFTSSFISKPTLLFLYSNDLFIDGLGRRRIGLILKIRIIITFLSIIRHDYEMF